MRARIATWLRRLATWIEPTQEWKSQGLAPSLYGLRIIVDKRCPPGKVFVIDPEFFKTIDLRKEA